ncbi:MAG: hypothetical protein AAGF83_17150 [Cyanobacteria bacterium P01_G01_bin.67]
MSQRIIQSCFVGERTTRDFSRLKQQQFNSANYAIAWLAFFLANVSYFKAQPNVLNLNLGKPH